MAYYKWKPKAADIAKLEQDIKDFENEIIKLEQEYKISIRVNNAGNSIYLNWNKQNYRISTHHSELGELTGVNGSGYNLPDNNIVTRGRKNIIKILTNILKGEN